MVYLRQAGCEKEEVELHSDIPCQVVVQGETHKGPTWESINVSYKKVIIWLREENEGRRQWSFDKEERLIYYEQLLVGCLPPATSSLLQSQRSNDSKKLRNGMREKTPPTHFLLQVRVTCLCHLVLHRKRAAN